MPDNSQITLHPGSSLRYQTAFMGPKREVYLQGEAFFKVSKNPQRPFLVLTKQVVTTVLGTSFRVKAYTGSKKAAILRPNAPESGPQNIRKIRYADILLMKAEAAAQPAQPARRSCSLS